MKNGNAPSRWRSRLQAERGFFALALMVAPALVLGSSIIASLVEPSESMPTGETASSGTGMGYAVAFLILSALLFARSSTQAAAFGAQLPRATSIRVGWARAALIMVVTLGIMTGVGVLSAWSSVVFDVVPPGGADMDASAWAQTWSLAHALALSVYAGFAEEVLLLALPVAAGSWLGRRISGAGGELGWMLAGGLAGLAIRSVLHFYQGWTSSVSALIWGGALLVIFLIWRSIYPLIAAHVLFDVVVAWWAPQTEYQEPIYWTLVCLGIAAAAVLFILGRRERSKLADHDASESTRVSPSTVSAERR